MLRNASLILLNILMVALAALFIIIHHYSCCQAVMTLTLPALLTCSLNNMYMIPTHAPVKVNSGLAHAPFDFDYFVALTSTFLCIWNVSDTTGSAET